MRIPASVSHLGGGLFKGCHNLKTITIDSLNQYYKVVDTAVYSINMDTLISYHLASGNVEVPGGVKVVAEDAFSLSKARNVELPDGLIEIKEGAFGDVLTLRSVAFPQTLKKIGMSAFAYCERLETIDIPNSVTSIDTCAFEGCYLLHTVRMSDSVKIIPTMLFYACLSLNTYTGGNSVERIMHNAFCYTGFSNKKIIFPSSLKVIELDAFDGNAEEAWEFRLGFADLSANCFRLQEALWEYGSREDFDDCTVALVGNRYDLVGFDSFEEDYYSLCRYEAELAGTEAGKRLMRKTKPEMISSIGQALGTLMAFLDLRDRYYGLKATLDILRDENHSILQTVKAIEEAYEKAAEHPESWNKDSRAFDQLMDLLPPRLWVE